TYFSRFLRRACRCSSQSVTVEHRGAAKRPNRRLESSDPDVPAPCRRAAAETAARRSRTASLRTFFDLPGVLDLALGLVLFVQFVVGLLDLFVVQRELLCGHLAAFGGAADAVAGDANVRQFPHQIGRAARAAV